MMNSNDALRQATALHQQALDLRSFLSMHEFHMHKQAIDADDEIEDDESAVPMHVSYTNQELRRGIILFDPKDMEQQDNQALAQSLEPENNSTMLEEQKDQTENVVVNGQVTSLVSLDNQKTHDPNIRNKIILEICSTERNYVRDIRTLHDYYIVPLEECKHPIMEDAQIAVFFNNLRQLVMLNSKLHNDLMTIVHQRHLSLTDSTSVSTIPLDIVSKSEGIGAVFCRYAPLFKLYGGYAKNYQEVAQILTNCQQDKQLGFQEFLQQCQLKSGTSKSFDSLLIMPIQRIPLYQLLLARMCEYTSIEHPDYYYLHQAVERVEGAASLMNETIRDQENLSRVLEAQKQFAGQVSLITPSRRLLRKGMLIKISTRRQEDVMIHLFNDLLLYSSILITGGYRVRRVVQLHSKAVRVQASLPTTYRTFNTGLILCCGFMITSLEKTFVLFASNEQEKREWVDAICRAIEIAQAPLTPTMESAADAAALWVPDSVAGACSVCLVSFKVYFRRHHCRRCGAVVCGNCSDHRSILFVTDSIKEERVCSPCFRVLSRVKRMAYRWLDRVVEYRGILRRKRSNEKWSEHYYELRAGVLRQYTVASVLPSHARICTETVLLAGAIVIHRSDERSPKNQFSFQISIGMDRQEEEEQDVEEEGCISPCTTHSPNGSHPPSPLGSCRTMSSTKLRQKLSPLKNAVVSRFRRDSSVLSSEGSSSNLIRTSILETGWILCATSYEAEKAWSNAIQRSADRALAKSRRSRVTECPLFDPSTLSGLWNEVAIGTEEDSNERHRTRILHEIIRSEESYVTCLGECIQLYVQPLLLRQLEIQQRRRKASRTTRPPLTSLRKLASTGSNKLLIASEHRARLRAMGMGIHTKESFVLDADMAIFFTSMDQLCTLNQQLLEHLSRHIEEVKQEQSCIYRPGAIFHAYAPLFQLYSAYASRHEAAQKIITSSGFISFLQQLPDQTTSIHRLQTFLTMPMERIPRYKLFLQELLEYTVPEHIDYGPLQNAIQSIDQVANKIQEIMKRHENTRTLNLVSQRIGMDLSGKQCIQEGILKKVCRSKVQKYYFVLLEDALIYGRMGTPLHKKKFRQIDLWECKVQGNTASIPSVIHASAGSTSSNAFYFFSPLKSFILLASSLEEKTKWIHNLHECIEKTLQTPIRSSIRSELLLDDEEEKEISWDSDTALVIKNGWLNVVSEDGTRTMTRRMWITLTQQSISFASTFKGAQPEENIVISTCTASSMTEETYFQLLVGTKKERIYLFETQSYLEREEWLRALNHCISGSKTKSNAIEIRRRSLNSAALAPIFMFNKVSNVCTLCFHTFAVYRPRHHCRVCGCLVCGNCSKRKWALSYSSSKKASRVCDQCADSASHSVSSDSGNNQNV